MNRLLCVSPLLSLVRSVPFYRTAPLDIFFLFLISFIFLFLIGFYSFCFIIFNLVGKSYLVSTATAYEDEHRENARGQKIVLRSVQKDVEFSVKVNTVKQAEKIQKMVDSGRYDLNKFEFIESDGTGEYSLRFPRSKVPFTVKEKAALKSAFADFL